VKKFGRRNSMDISEKLDKPVCDCCSLGMEEVKAREEAMLKKHGWLAHYVCDDPDAPFMINYHTHGLPASIKHKDLQACVPIPYEALHFIVTGIIARIKAGESFAAGDKIFDIIENYPITFIDAKECDRDVLRVIFPDQTGCLDKDEMDEALAKQYERK
jgi:hypothetical protein